MLTYTPPSEIQPPKPTERPWLLFLLCVIWVTPGLIGHDPWKPDEPFAVGVIHNMLQSGRWLIPSLAGTPVLDHAPFFYQISAALAKLCSPRLLPLHDAARLAVGLFIALALTFCGGAGRELIGRRSGRVAVISLIGCLGLLVRGHMLVSDVATFAGFALAFYGMVLALRLPGLAGLALGCGSGLAGATATLFEPGLIWLIALLLPAFFQHWRSREYAITLVIGLFIALPWLVIWPLWLLKTSPDLFLLWWDQGALSRFKGFAELGVLREIWYYLGILPWFAWPALPLACWTLWDSRLLGYARPHIQFPLLALAVMLPALMFSPQPKDLYALPLLLPLALLAAAGIDRLRRGAANALNWFGVMTFGMMAIYIWIGWSAAHFGLPARLARRAGEIAPGFQAQINWGAFLLAFTLSLIWIWAVTRRRQRGRQALTNWASGVTLNWALLMLLWLPGIDWVKSYRGMIVEFQAALPKAAGCIGTEGLNGAQLALFDYYTGIKLEPHAAGQCKLMLTQGGRDEVPPVGTWRKLWESGRPGDRKERYRLYLQVEPVSQPL